MNIVLCIKQVPGTSKVEIDELTGVLKRDGVESKLNPYDLYAIETAVRLKEQYGGNVKAITMGPMQACAVLKEALEMGADDAAIVTDKTFAGADVLATSYALSQGIHLFGGYDLIICGKQTTDGDTAQVGPEIAEFLGIPHVAGVTKIISLQNGIIRLEADMGQYLEVADVTLPCLITVEKGIYVPRLPSYKRRITYADKEISVYSLSDLDDKNPVMYGINGSPTQVERVFPPEATTERVLITGTAEDMAEQVFSRLLQDKLI